ncbi:hypothetical protein Vretifemale_3009, partial [Volvox reticuliferus]
EMKALNSKFLSEPIFRLEVAARVSLRQRNVVSRDLPVPSVLARDDLPHQRILKPRTSQKASFPSPREEEPPPVPQREPLHDDGGRSKDVRSQPRRWMEGPRDEINGDDISLNLDRGRIRGRDRVRERDGGGARAWNDEWPRGGREGGPFRRLPSSDGGSGRRSPKNWEQSRDRNPPPPRPPPVPIDGKMARSPRFLAVQQLMRVEEEGAYVGLVNGSPATPTQPRGWANRMEGADGDSEVEAYGGDDGTALRWRRAEGGAGGRGPREGPFDPRDQRLVKELVAGVTRLRRRLDYIVSNLSQQTPSDMESGVRQALRLGVYELTERHLAPYALNEHVQLAKAVSGPVAGPFVNGVLRSAARHLEAGTLPTPESRAAGEGSRSSGVDGSGGGGDGARPGGGREALRLLALQHSHPNWMVSRWLERFGREGAEQLLRRNNQPPVYTVRVNTLRPGASAAGLLEQLAAAGIQAELSPLLPEEFIRIRSGLQKLLAEGFVSNGSLVVQDESAGLVVSLLDPQPGEKLLDCCAAPGGKTLFAAARMQGKGSITALDISAPRLGALRRAAELAGVSDMVSTHACDLRDWTRKAAERAVWLAEMRPAAPPAAAVGGGGGGAVEVPGSRDTGFGQPITTLWYDKVLLDAPCTGTGVLAKRADLRWRRTPEQLQELITLQDELLDAAASMVAPGGILVYSTCSVEEEEDHQRVRAFLNRHPEFQLDLATRGTADGPAGSPSPCVPPEVVTAEGYVATLPHVHDTDGAFAARLRRLQ